MRASATVWSAHGTRKDGVGKSTRPCDVASEPGGESWRETSFPPFVASGVCGRILVLIRTGSSFRGIDRHLRFAGDDPVATPSETKSAMAHRRVFRQRKTRHSCGTPAGRHIRPPWQALAPGVSRPTKPRFRADEAALPCQHILLRLPTDFQPDAHATARCVKITTTPRPPSSQPATGGTVRLTPCLNGRWL
jgi:hypothetical protein